MKIQMDGNIFSFLHFYQKNDKKNFTGKPYLFLHLSDESKTEVGLTFIKEFFNVIPDAVEEATLEDEVLFYCFSNPETIDTLIDKIVENDWLIDTNNTNDTDTKNTKDTEKVAKLREFQQSLQFPGKLPKNFGAQSPANINQPTNSKNKTTTVSSLNATTTTTQLIQDAPTQSNFAPKILESDEVDEHHNDDYSDEDDKKNIFTTTTSKNQIQTTQIDSIKIDTVAKNSNLSKMQIIEIDHEKAIVETIRQGNIELLRVLLAVETPTDADYQQMETLEINLLYQQYSQLEATYLLRLMNILSTDINIWQQTPPNKEIVQIRIAFLISIVREIEFNAQISNFNKDKWASIIEENSIKKTDDVNLFEPWLRNRIDKAASSIYNEFLSILEEDNITFIVAQLETKKDEAQGACTELLTAKVAKVEEFSHQEMKVQTKIQNHQRAVDQLLEKAELLPEAYQQNRLEQYNGIWRPKPDNNGAWMPNPAESDDLTKLMSKNKLVVNVQNSILSICWVKNNKLLQIKLTKKDSLEIIPHLPDVDEVSTNQIWANSLGLKCSFAQLKNDLYQFKIDPNLLINGKSLLYYALIHKQYLSVKLLLLHGADIDLLLDTKKTVYEELNINRAVLEEIKKDSTNELISLESSYQRDAIKHIHEYQTKLEAKAKSFFGRLFLNEEIFKERRMHIDEYLASSARAKMLHDDNIFYKTVVSIYKNKFSTGAFGQSSLHSEIYKKTLKFKRHHDYGLTPERIRNILVADKDLNKQLVDLEKNLEVQNKEIARLENEKRELTELNKALNDKLKFQDEKLKAQDEKLELQAAQNKELASQNKALDEKFELQKAENKELKEKIKSQDEKFESQAKNSEAMEKKFALRDEQTQKMIQQMQLQMQQFQQQMLQQQQFMGQQKFEPPAPGY